MTMPGPTQHEIAAQRELSLSRRRFLRGVGACVALPAFHSLLPPLRALGSEALAATASAATSTGAPLRMAFVTFPNGANLHNWWPTGDGKEFQFNKTMRALESVKQHIQIVSGLDHINATPGSDGGGDHARANATLLTGMRAKKTSGSDIQVGVSIDQLAAQHVGNLTRFPSLELTCGHIRKSGDCDSGYACAYQYNVSWRSPTNPMPAEPNPRLVFERLFGAGESDQRRKSFLMRQQSQRSVLDFILDDTRSLQRKMSQKDEQKLDEYLTSVREIERRLHQAERFGPPPDPHAATPVGVPTAFDDRMDLMYDMLLLAFQTDSTRIATMMLGHDGDNQSYPQIGIDEGHHYLSHHGDKPERLDKIGKIDQHLVTHFARFLEKLAATKDVDGRSLLDNSMIVYACGNADGDNHTHENLPVLLAGAGGGTLQPGRFTKVPSQPMCNLFMGMLDRMGVEGVDRFGDSDNRITQV